MSGFVLPPWVPVSVLAMLGLAAWMTRQRLRHLPVLPEDARLEAWPSICVCIPARDEVREIGPALDAWLAQDYPGLRIVVVDDGSTDGTTELLAQRQARCPERLVVIRNDHLPPGWLGKNHALDLATAAPAAQEAEWLLLADADVRVAPDLVRRAMGFLQQAPADLLTLIAAVEAHGLAERLFIPPAMMQFLWLIPPRKVTDPRSRFCCGTGAFMLVRRQVYDAVGGHAKAPLDPVDDMGLARRVKQAGFTNRVAKGGPDVRLRMYHDGWEILRAMRKNVLGVPYLWLFSPLLVLVFLGFHTSPVWLALGGWPGAALTVWLLYPALIGETYQRLTHRPLDWIWGFWPVVGLMVAAGIGWAFVDRLRGINHWRGRNVPLKPRG